MEGRRDASSASTRGSRSRVTCDNADGPVSAWSSPAATAACQVPTSLKALAVSTTSSLAAVVMATITAGPQATLWVMWACWAALAVITVALSVADRRQRSGSLAPNRA